jgi:hypothetical protein
VKVNNDNILKIFVGLSMPFNGFLGDLLLETTKINPITFIILKQREYLNITGMVFLHPEKKYARGITLMFMPTTCEEKQSNMGVFV